jgi:hypothetical protein
MIIIHFIFIPIKISFIKEKVSRTFRKVGNLEADFVDEIKM